MDGSPLPAGDLCARLMLAGLGEVGGRAGDAQTAGRISLALAQSGGALLSRAARPPGCCATTLCAEGARCLVGSCRGWLWCCWRWCCWCRLGSRWRLIRRRRYLERPCRRRLRRRRHRFLVRRCRPLIPRRRWFRRERRWRPQLRPGSRWLLMKAGRWSLRRAVFSLSGTCLRRLAVRWCARLRLGLEDRLSVG